MDTETTARSVEKLAKHYHNFPGKTGTGRYQRIELPLTNAGADGSPASARVFKSMQLDAVPDAVFAVSKSAGNAVAYPDDPRQLDAP